MKLQHIKRRSYRESVGLRQARRISDTISDLHDIRKQRSAYNFYAYELQGCLSYGLMLAAVSIATAMLELFVRDLWTAQRIIIRHGGNTKLRGQIQREAEKDRKITFSQMLQDLKSIVIQEKDVEKLTDFYDQTRIPVAHALVRRMTSSPGDSDEWSDQFSDSSSYDLEERFGKRAIEDVRFTVQTIKKYLPWLIRRANANDAQATGEVRA